MFGRLNFSITDQLVAGGQPVVIEPLLAVQPARFDHQRVALPAALREAQPARIEVVGELAPVEVHLAPQVERFVDEHHQLVGLHDLERHRRLVDLGHALRQAVRVGLLVAQEAGGARGVNLLRARRSSARSRGRCRPRGSGSSGSSACRCRSDPACRMPCAASAPTGSACRRGRSARGSAGCATGRRPEPRRAAPRGPRHLRGRTRNGHGTWDG